MIVRRILALILPFCTSLVLAAAESTLVFSPPKPAPAAKHVVLLSGDEEYRSEEALPMLAKILSQRHGFKTTVLFALDPDGVINPNNVSSLPGAEALDTADVIVMSLRFRNWPEAQMKHFVGAFRRGVPIIALRTSTHAFKIPGGTYAPFTDFGKNVLGERWVSHWGKHKVEATLAKPEPSAGSNPVLRGVGEIFCTTDVYEAHPPADARILMRGLVLTGLNRGDPPATTVKKRSTDKREQPVNDPAMPVAWTRVYRNEAGKQNRILTTTMGAATDFEDESLRRLIVNGVYWALGRDVPARADVRVVDPYFPTAYGFNGFRAGLTPADHALGRTLRPGDPRPPTENKNPKPAPSPVIPAVVGSPLAILPGERIAIIGNALADRMQHHGSLETLLQAKYPQHNLVVRNLAFAGDEVVDRARSKDFGTPDEWLTRVGANVVFAFFGFNESFRGAEGLPQFKEDLARFLQETHARNYSGAGSPRIVLFSPIAAEKLADPNRAVPESVNRNLALYAAAMAEVARDRAGVTFIDLFTPSQALYAEAAKAGRSLTYNGVHLNAAGDAALAPVMFKAMTGEAVPQGDFSKLTEEIIRKNEMWHSRYRTVDGYNIYGDRSKIEYVSYPDSPKITNTQIMMEEMAQRDVMTANLERKIWALAGGKTGPVEMLPMPVVTAFGTNKPGPNIDGTYPFVDGDEAVGLMTLAPGLKANLFASEKQFPELAKAVQMNFDPKGRLWVAVWPSYPERTPLSRVADKILILEDTNRDGRADKCTIFMDDLNCPTGFQFFKDGILLVQAPDVWFVRDTDGDGHADWKERVLMGLDSADSHHTANSLIYEPGGAILLSDGVFHRTQVETPAGAVRNIDAAIYRYEPLTNRFETYVSYGFANPHGRAFDYWGNDLITDATGNNTYFGPAFSGRIDYPNKHPRMNTLWDRPSRPSAGSTILTSRHFPDEYWGDYLNPNVIGFQGIFRVNLSADGSGIKGTREPDVVQSSDFNFRPIDTATGPDGALYVIDWHNPLIGHLQSHLRDSNRDHVHGRIYRITCEGRPLAWQPRIDGEPVAALLELLKRKENQIRNLAKVELGKHDAAEVTAAVRTWVDKLDPKDPDYAHDLTEALWVHQWHNIVNLDLLQRVIHSSNADARAAGARVISYWRERVPTALDDLARLAADESPRVRLHAVRAASFFADVRATDVALIAARHGVDYYLDYTIGETLRQLRPLWTRSLNDGRAFAGGDTASTRYLLRTLSTTDALKLARSPEVLENLLGRGDLSDTTRADVLAGLVKIRGQPAPQLLLEVINAPGEMDVAGLGRLLVAQSPESLRAQRAALLKLGLTDTSEGRSYGWAALAVADGSLEPAWKAAADSPLSMQSVLGAIALIPDQAIRASAFDQVMPFLTRPVTDLSGPDQIVAASQRDAIRAAVSMRREPATVFTALVGMIERGSQVPTAAQGLRTLPRSAWSEAGVSGAAHALIAWASQVPTGERTQRQYVETIQVADDLVARLTPAEGGPLRKAISSLRVPVYVIRTVHEEMRYDTPRIVVPVNKPIELIFENADAMPHNLVVVQPGARERVATAALALPPEHRDGAGRAWVPESREILASTHLLEPGRTETLKLKPIEQEGVYEYVCTFPGHWTLMWGQLIVTSQPDAPVPANLPVPPGGIPAATGAAHTDHGH